MRTLNPIKLLGAAVLLAVALLGSCMSTVYVDPGSAGVVIHKLGGGVDPTPVGAGWQLRNPFATQIVEYPTRMQTLVLARSAKEGSGDNDEINVTTIEGQPASLDVSLSFELDARKVPELYQTFRTDIEKITHSYVKQTVRSAIQEVMGRDSIVNVMGRDKEAARVQIEQSVQRRLTQYGFLVKQFTINELRAPESIVAAINAKNVMTQKAIEAQNQLVQKSAIARGDSIAAAGKGNAVLVEARAQAEAAKLLASNTNSEQFLRLKELEIRKITAERWDGALPQNMYGNQPVPIVSLAPPAPKK
jgi:regulator of protease activity HflC (stomatin/prohibitin superfamily)